MATSNGESESSNTPQLSVLFEEARQIQTNLEDCTIPSSSQEYQGNVKKAIGQFEEVTRMVSQLSLFSRNEEIEECPTAHIRYLLLPAFLGDLTLKLQVEDRLELVRKALAYFTDYMRRCRDYGVTKEEIPEAPAEDMETDGAVPRASPAKPNLAAMQSEREAKIRRYKESKELKEKLAALGDWNAMNTKDEDVQRKFFLLMLKKWVQTALEQLNAIHQEMEILQYMAKMKKAGGPHPGGDGPGVGREQPPPQRKPMKPFILTKDALQAQVFGAGYPSIPTMTMDEFYQKEIREGKIQLPDPNNPPPSQKSDREQVEEIEIRKEMEVETDDPAALKKAREWDEYTDDHKRGWGNRENMG